MSVIQQVTDVDNYTFKKKITENIFIVIEVFVIKL